MDLLASAWLFLVLCVCVCVCVSLSVWFFIGMIFVHGHRLVDMGMIFSCVFHGHDIFHGHDLFFTCGFPIV